MLQARSLCSNARKKSVRSHHRHGRTSVSSSARMLRMYLFEAAGVLMTRVEMVGAESLGHEARQAQ
jgi:hypothetical protein